jgi:hypothetical protein
MPRINHVQKARKDQGNCGRCRAHIPAGAPYKYIEFRYGGRHVRCDSASCHFRPSELTQSKLSQALAAQESAQDGIAEWQPEGHEVDDLRQILEDAAQEIRDCAQEYRDSADNINQTAEGSSVAQDCEEKADQLEEWADSIESEASNLQDMDDEEPEEPEEPGEDATPEEREQHKADHAKWEEAHEEWKSKQDDWAQEQRDAAEAALGECPC